MGVTLALQHGPEPGGAAQEQWLLSHLSAVPRGGVGLWGGCPHCSSPHTHSVPQDPALWGGPTSVPTVLRRTGFGDGCREAQIASRALSPEPKGRAGCRPQPRGCAGCFLPALW